jgi:hypothetical protein
MKGNTAYERPKPNPAPKITDKMTVTTILPSIMNSSITMILNKINYDI